MVFANKQDIEGALKPEDIKNVRFFTLTMNNLFILSGFELEPPLYNQELLLLTVVMAHAHTLIM